MTTIITRRMGSSSRLVLAMFVTFATVHTIGLYPRLQSYWEGNTAVDTDNNNNNNNKSNHQQHHTGRRWQQQQEQGENSSPHLPSSASSFVDVMVKAARNKTGMWVVDSWIPPAPWRLYSPAELQEYYQNRSMLWIGDSTVRRTSLMMFELLSLHNNNNNNNNNVSTTTTTTTTTRYVTDREVNHGSIIDEGKPNTPKRYPCSIPEISDAHDQPTGCGRPPPGHQQLDHKMDNMDNNNNNNNNTITTNGTKNHNVYHGKTKWNAFWWSEWFHTLAQQLTAHTIPMENFDVVVIGMGIWDIIRAPKYVNTVPIEERVHQVLQLLDAFQQQPIMQQHNTKIIWRTSGIADFENPQQGHTYNASMRLNQAVMAGIEAIAEKHWQNGRRVSNITYFDWGGAVAPRSIGKDRIKGDMAPHYGFLPRFVAIQMLTNHLMDLERYYSW